MYDPIIRQSKHSETDAEHPIVEMLRHGWTMIVVGSSNMIDQIRIKIRTTDINSAPGRVAPHHHIILNSTTDRSRSSTTSWIGETEIN